MEELFGFPTDQLMWALLAVTGAGGDVLFIEATAMPGDARLNLTGQLGDVMKESAQIALSYLRSHRPDLAGALDRSVHLHVPAGAVPDDPGDLLGSPRTGSVLARLRARYDVVLVDAPPLVPTVDAAVLARKSIVISGDQGAGKTTLLRALIHAIPTTERFGTLETDYELMTHLQPGRKNILALQARVGHGDVIRVGDGAVVGGGDSLERRGELDPLRGFEGRNGGGVDRISELPSDARSRPSDLLDHPNASARRARSRAAWPSGRRSLPPPRRPP